MAAPTPDALLPRFKEYVTSTGTADDENATVSLTEAHALVTAYCGAFIAAVPAPVLGRAIVEVAAELFYHKAARGGVTEWAGTDLQPFRLARDPMKAAYPLLLQFIPGGLA